MRRVALVRDDVPSQQREYLKNPFALHNVRTLHNLPDRGSTDRAVRVWRVAGPFPLEWDGEHGPDKTMPGFDRAYAPEVEGSEAPFSTLGGPAGWQTVYADLSGLVGLREHVLPPDNVVAYAQSVVIAPREMSSEVHLGHNDGAKLFVNGEEVYSNDRGGYARPGDNTVEVQLKEGRNTLLLKVANLGNAWAFYFSVDDPERVLRFAIE